MNARLKDYMKPIIEQQIYDKLLDIKSQRSVVGNKIHFVYGFKSLFTFFHL